MEKKKVLFVSQEISPFLTKTEIAGSTRRLSQGIQESGKEIRVFTPRFGSINERRHQLHEVIRLSGMNLIIDDTDHPLIIKVASVATAKMQVYFIDNEEYFKRKSGLTDEKGNFFEDNDERAMFFCRGVLETVKKLGWQPDVIHCHGWMTALMALYIKKLYQKDPHFADTKVVYCLYNDGFDGKWDKRLGEKLKFDGFDDEIVNQFSENTYLNISKIIAKYADGLNIGSEHLNADLQKVYDEATCLKQGYIPEEQQTKVMSEFFDKIIEETVPV